jgi:hypothetical protein
MEEVPMRRSRLTKLMRMVIKVTNVRSRKVFRWGSVCFDKLYSYDVLPVSKEQLVLKVYRGNEQVDSGRIEEFGTHGASHMFMGFKIACPSAPAQYDFNLIGYVLEPGWFQNGDELRFTGSRSDLRRNLLDHWYRLLEQTKFKKQYHRAEVRRGKLVSALIEKAGGWSALKASKDPKDASRILEDAYRKAHGTLQKRMRAVPLPAVIKWRAR